MMYLLSVKCIVLDRSLDGFAGEVGRCPSIHSCHHVYHHTTWTQQHCRILFTRGSHRHASLELSHGVFLFVVLTLVRMYLLVG